ncbi:MAG: galactose-1-phosphate uridylyltransferase [Patescibacteria group bacterium]|nr:galactose-1-phosphate uridylyltransferase [Patescibacteria group bacterium]
MAKKIIKFPSELRADPLSKDWVIIATGRARRLETFKKEKREKIIPSKRTCPFCHLGKKDKPILVFANGKKIVAKKFPKNWTIIVIPNKYPALAVDKSLQERTEGPYKRMNGIGYHEVVVTRDHQKSMGLFTVAEVKEVIDVYQERYLDLMNEPFVNYVSIFHNHGSEAGASIFHPHSQIIATPVIDPDLNRAISNSRKYFGENKKCIYCLMNNWEREQRERIVFENKEFLVICPFVSKTAFEMIISPKKHLPYFERISGEEKKYLAEAFKEALSRLYKALDDPPYNFYLHSAPCDGKNYDFYHWHFTILPKTATLAGFELCTGIEISTIEPEKAAEYLRKQ